MNQQTSNAEIGSRIRNMREYFHYTREYLADRACISVQFLADIETGRKSMTVKTLKSISLALNVSSDYLLFGSEDSSASENSTQLTNLFNGLSAVEQEYAEELLKVYIRALNAKK